MGNSHNSLRGRSTRSMPQVYLVHSRYCAWGVTGPTPQRPFSALRLIGSTRSISRRMTSVSKLTSVVIINCPGGLCRLDFQSGFFLVYLSIQSPLTLYFLGFQQSSCDFCTVLVCVVTNTVPCFISRPRWWEDDRSSLLGTTEQVVIQRPMATVPTSQGLLPSGSKIASTGPSRMRPGIASRTP